MWTTIINLVRVVVIARRLIHCSSVNLLPSLVLWIQPSSLFLRYKVGKKGNRVRAITIPTNGPNVHKQRWGENYLRTPIGRRREGGVDPC